MSAQLEHAVRPNPVKTAIGAGASGTGFHHWWLQRLTAVALVPLSLWFLFFIVDLGSANYAQVLAAVGEPINALLLIVLVICAFWHGVLGLDVIVQDYVHTPALDLGLRIATRFGAVIAVLASVMAVLTIWLGARG